jgi:hypothetical protein
MLYDVWVGKMLKGNYSINNSLLIHDFSSVILKKLPERIRNGFYPEQVHAKCYKISGVDAVSFRSRTTKLVDHFQSGWYLHVHASWIV